MCVLCLSGVCVCVLCLSGVFEWCVVCVCVVFEWCVCVLCLTGWRRDLNVFAREELSLKVIKVFKERAVSRQKPIHRGPYRLF